MSTERFFEALLPEAGDGRDYRIRLMREAHLEADGTESRRGMEAAYDALRELLVPAPIAGQKGDSE